MLLLALITSALVVPFAYLLGQRSGARAGWPLSVGLLVVSALLWWVRPADGAVVEQSTPWMPSLEVAIHLRLDGLGFLFAQIVLLVGALVMAYSAGYLGPGRHGTFYGLMTFFAAAMLGLVLADDLVLMFVMWEFTTLCSFLLIARSGPEAKDPAIRTLLVTVAGGLALLAAVVLLWNATGTTRLSEVLVHDMWTESPTAEAGVAALVAVAAFTKSAQMPFHGWLPDAMVAITPVSAYLHAAAMVKAGIYLMLRFAPAAQDITLWSAMLVTVGTLTAVLGAVFALQRHDLKELLAHSTVSQLGLITATIGIGTPLALTAAVVHTTAHALFKAALFMGVGVIDKTAGTRDLRDLSGLARTMPWTSGTLLLAAASMAGIPPLMGFVSKEKILDAVAGAPWSGVTIVVVGTGLVAGAAVTVAYSARVCLTTMPGAPAGSPPREAAPGFVLPAAVPAAAAVFLGVAGPLAVGVLGAAALAAGGQVEPDLTLWHGLTPALAMSVAALAGGGLLVLGRNHVDRVLDRRLAPVDQIEVVDRLRRGAILVGERVGDPTRVDAPGRHLALVVGCLVALAAGLTVTAEAPRGTSPPASHLSDWLLLGFVAIGTALLLVSHTRIALVVVLGVVGFSVALWFYLLGSPDVALTQLLVEVLTVAVMVLVLTRLPARFHRTGRFRTVVAAALGLVTAVSAGVAAHTFTGRRSISEVGETYLADGEKLTGGSNLVNTILVDFRALDTLGELTVLAVAGVGVFAALESRGLLPRRPSPMTQPAMSPALDSRQNTIILRAGQRSLGPVMVVLSLYVLLRGHDEPGGGFISALILGSGLTLVYLAAPDDDVRTSPVSYSLLLGGGVVLAVLVGLLGFVDGSFLRPLSLPVVGTSALLFDLGVYLTVAGLVHATLTRLGGHTGLDRTPQRRGWRRVDVRNVSRARTTDVPHDPGTTPLPEAVGDADRTVAGGSGPPDREGGSRWR
jgi:multicomponent Na+:H+ antiporter subunit A